MKKKIVTLTCTVLLMAGTYSTANAQSRYQNSNALAADLNSKVNNNTTLEEVRALFGEPSNVTYSSDVTVWTYMNYDGERAISSQEIRTRNENRRNSSRSSTTSSQSTITKSSETKKKKKSGFGSFGRGLGSIVGGDAGRVMRGLGDAADSAANNSQGQTDSRTERTTTTTTQRSGTSYQSVSDTTPLVFMSFSFNTATQKVDFYAIGPN